MSSVIQVELFQQELDTIEQPVNVVIRRWHQWASSLFSSSSSVEPLPNVLLQLFGGADDDLVESMLCALDVRVAAGLLQQHQHNREGNVLSLLNI